MTRFRAFAAPLMLALAFGLIATAAEAAPGTTRTTAIVHKSPSSSSSAMASLKTGTYVVVVKCTSLWCLVHRSGLDGWVRRSSIYNPYYGSRIYYQFPPYTPVPGRTNRSDLR